MVIFVACLPAVNKMDKKIKLAEMEVDYVCMWVF